MGNRLDLDTAARERVLDPRQSFIVQAPAGSGKTELLMQRYLRLLSLPSVVEPEAVLAITFTNKAAAEMRLRILRALESAANDPGEALPPHKAATRALALEVLHRDRARDWRLIENPARLRIQTIDSFCYQLAQKSPLATGISSSANIVEKPKPLYIEAARRTVHELSHDGEIGEAVAQLLRRIDNNLGKLHGLICGMLDRREQWMNRLGSAHSETELDAIRAKLEHSLQVVIEQELARVRRVVSRSLSPGEQREMFGYMDHAARHIDDNACIQSLADINGLPGATYGECQRWLGIREFLLKADGDFRVRVNVSNGFPRNDPSTRDNCMAWLEQVAGGDNAGAMRSALLRLDKIPPATYSDDDWTCLRALFKVLPVAVAHLKKIFADENAIDFAEIAQGARAALSAEGGASDLALLLGEKIQHVLVDEFQDTSVAQMELLGLLTAAWEQSNTLFVVGDPKQSIYGFREAEVRLFTEAYANAEVASVTCERADLSKNFRSQHCLVEWFNRVFSELLKGEVRYPDEPVVAVKDGLPGEAVSVGGYVGKSLKDEARDVAEAVESSLAAGANDVCILLRSRTHAAHLVPALREKGIQFRGVELEKLTARPTVRDLDALTRALLHPCDRLAWLAILRAPWCGLNLDDLWRLCEGDKKTSVPELLRARVTRLSDAARARLGRVLPVLGAAIAQRDRIPLRSLVEGTWLALGGPAAVRGGDEGAADLRDARAYLDLLVANEDAAKHDRIRFQERLDELFSPPDNSDGIRVHIMTMHKAKGLEFDTVIVPSLGRKTRSDDERLLHWREHVVGSTPHLLMAPVDEVGASASAASLVDYIKLLASESELDEDKRLLYVAATRAKRKLYFFGAVEDKPEREPHRDSLLALLMQSPTFAAQFTTTLPPPGNGSNAAVEEPPASRQPARFRRLPETWVAPSWPPPLVWQDHRTPRASGEVEHTFDWVDGLQVTGTVAHAFFEQVARDGLEKWTPDTAEARRPAIRAALLASGISPSRLDREAERVVCALQNLVSDVDGRWVLEPHLNASSEFDLTIPAPEGTQRVKFDRTFVCDGIRWIVDFKLTYDTDLTAQVEKYRPDMERYALAMRTYDSRPVQTALYFPLQKKLLRVT